MMNMWIGGLSVVLYLIAGGLLLRRLRRAGQEGVGSKTAPLAIGGVAVILHLIVALHLVTTPTGLNLNFSYALSLIGALISALLLVAASVQPVENLGIVVMPCAALTVIPALILSPSHRITDTHLWPLEWHIVMAIASYALLTLAAIQAILLTFQEYRLRHRQLGGILRGLPPLTTMEALLFQMIGAGFVLLSVTLATGFLFLEDMFAQHVAHKTLLSAIAWTVFGTLLWGRSAFGWRGRTATRWTLIGFTCLVLAYFGSKLVLEVILGR